MTMLAQEAKQLLRPPLEQRLLTPIQFLRGIPAWNSHRLLLALCVYGGADHTLGIEVDPEVVTDRNDLVFEPIGALVFHQKGSIHIMAFVQNANGEITELRELHKYNEAVRQRVPTPAGSGPP